MLVKLSKNSQFFENFIELQTWDFLKVVSFVSEEWLEWIAVGVEVRVSGAQTYLSGSERLGAADSTHCDLW